MTNYFGIDFGTTNSAVVRYESRLKRFYNIGDEDENPFPSVVAIDNLTQKVAAGRRVRENIVRLREGGLHLVVESVKSILDRDEFWVTPSRKWQAADIAAELFAALSRRAEKAAGEPIRRAVVAIPIGMTPAKRAVLRKAAKQAGIEVTSFISEPTAAFIAHAKDLRHCRYVVVFDWGGGTLDISVLEIRSGCIIERFMDGAAKAGDYIDRRLAEWVHLRIAERNGLNLAFESVGSAERHILLNECEKCKRNLQQEDAVQEKIILGRYAGLERVEQVVTQEDFEAIVKSTVAEALDLLFNCVERSHVSKEEIGKLIVVGGTSKLLALRRELRRRWPQPNVIFPDDADWDIARGAAWLAATPGSYRIAESVGLILADGEYHSIFPAGTRLEDAHFDLNFGLVEDARTAVFDFATLNGSAGSPRRMGTLDVPALGFMDEIIKLRCEVTEDLVFQSTAASDSIPDGEKPFLYDRLRWMYEEPKESS
jgi:molecular chaperone DnaK